MQCTATREGGHKNIGSEGLPVVVSCAGVRVGFFFCCCLSPWRLAKGWLNQPENSSKSAKMRGRMKCSSDQSSLRLFCSGVPASEGDDTAHEKKGERGTDVENRGEWGV